MKHGLFHNCSTNFCQWIICSEIFSGRGLLSQLFASPSFVLSLLCQSPVFSFQQLHSFILSQRERDKRGTSRLLCHGSVSHGYPWRTMRAGFFELAETTLERLDASFLVCHNFQQSRHLWNEKLPGSSEEWFLVIPAHHCISVTADLNMKLRWQPIKIKLKFPEWGIFCF